MDPAIIVAVIALIGSLLSAGLSFYWQGHTVQRNRETEAEAILAKYREPLAFAAYELQSRLFNIVRGRFLDIYYRSLPKRDRRRHYALFNTLYVLGQYFAWTEIVRREIQFLSFPDVPRIKRYTERQEAVLALFNSDDRQLGEPLMIWRGEQRAIGELMTMGESGKAQCMGYAKFLQRLEKDPGFSGWFERLKLDIDNVAHRRTERLRQLQHALVDFVKELDPQSVRFPDEELKKLP